MRKLIALLSFFIIIAGIQSCQTTKSSTASKMLKFNFENGKGYDYEMIMDMDQELMGKTQEIGVTTYYAMDVVDDKEGIKTIRTRFNSFRMNMKMMGMNIDIDSDKPMPADTTEKDNPFEMMNKVFRAIKGQQFYMKVNTEGKVVEVTGIKELAANIIDSLALGEEVKDKMEASFEKQFNEQSMKDQFERAFFIFPNKEVKVGDSWEKNTEMAEPMPSRFLTTYTVKEIEGDMLTLDVKSRIEGTTPETKMKGTQNGTMVVDSKSGLIMDGEQDIEMVTEANNSPMKMKLKSRIKGKAR